MATFLYWLKQVLGLRQYEELGTTSNLIG